MQVPSPECPSPPTTHYDQPEMPEPPIGRGSQPELPEEGEPPSLQGRASTHAGAGRCLSLLHHVTVDLFSSLAFVWFGCEPPAYICMLIIAVGAIGDKGIVRTEENYTD